MGRKWGEAMNTLSPQEQKMVLHAQQALQNVSTQEAPKAVFDALHTCTPIVGGLVGTFARGGLDAMVSHVVGLPDNVIQGWFDAPREQLDMMMAPLVSAARGQLITQTMAGILREKLELPRIMTAANLGESAGYMVSDPQNASRRLTFLTFALDDKVEFTPRDSVVLGLLREDIHDALHRLRVPFVSYQSITAQLIENRCWGFVLVAPKTAQVVEMNMRARELVSKFAPSARIEYGKYVVTSFAMRAVFETRSKDSWMIRHVNGTGELEVTVHELKKEEHAIADDMWLVMMDETEYPQQAGIFAEYDLTAREEEIAVFLVETGLSYKQIADRLGTKYDTVRTQILTIYRKLEVHSRSELTAMLKARRLS
jgi:DNA-binding CsgD family transcriptional regulator